MTWQGQTRYCYDMIVDGKTVQMVQCGVVPVGIDDYPAAHIDLELNSVPAQWRYNILKGDICRFTWTIDGSKDALQWLP